MRGLAVHAVLLAAALMPRPGGAAEGSAIEQERERPAGYLPTPSLAVPALIVPPPPARGSAAHAADDEAYRESLRLRGGDRWKLATYDALGEYPAAIDRFSCALGVSITPQAMPRLYLLLRRVALDAGGAAAVAKSRFDRRRPFVAANDEICTPEFEQVFRADKSYPSSAAAIGWGWALVLAEIDPASASALLRRGLAYGNSREVCRVHWRSDVDAGRLIAAATVAQLHANADFLGELGDARRELAGARPAGARPGRDCAAEMAAMDMAAPGAPGETTR